MGVRVKLRIAIGDSSFEAVGLVNSGFETDTPQLLVPYRLLVSKNIDLSRLATPSIREYDTAGGTIAMNLYPRACRVSVIESDRTSKEVIADLVVSLIEREILISDALTEELGIIILSPKKGYWRFIDDKQDIVRHSCHPEIY